MEIENWFRRYNLTPNRNANYWYFAIYCQPKFEFKIQIDTWTCGIWIFGFGIAIEKFPF